MAIFHGRQFSVFGRQFSIVEGVLPINQARISTDIIAGVTLVALAAIMPTQVSAPR